MADDRHDGESAAGDGDVGRTSVARAVLSDSVEGRTISSEFVATFGAFMTDRVRPVLREVAAGGGEPQLLVNGLAQLMRDVAASIEMEPGAPRTEPEAG